MPLNLHVCEGSLSIIHGGKGLLISHVDLSHLGDRERKAIGDFGNMRDLIKRKLPSLARFQILIKHLIATDMKVPDILGNGFEGLGLVYPDCLFRLGISDRF